MSHWNKLDFSQYVYISWKITLFKFSKIKHSLLAQQLPGLFNLLLNIIIFPFSPLLERMSKKVYFKSITFGKLLSVKHCSWQIKAWMAKWWRKQRWNGGMDYKQQTGHFNICNFALWVVKKAKAIYTDLNFKQSNFRSISNAQSLQKTKVLKSISIIAKVQMFHLNLSWKVQISFFSKWLPFLLLKTHWSCASCEDYIAQCFFKNIIK